MSAQALRRDAALLALLFVLPIAAHAPAWREGRLLGPGDGAALHYPLRAAVWDAYRHGEVPSWNPGIFLGTPLLAAYRPGAFYPPMAALYSLPSFLAFQILVLASLGAAGVLVFLYVRRLGGERVGAFVAGLAYTLGPYLVGHLGDTATLVASPLLPLLLLAAESHVSRASVPRAAGLAAALALVLVAGSPEAARAGIALVVGRLVVGHVLRTPRTPAVAISVLAVAAGVLLAAPQLVPTLLAAREAGRSVTGLASPAAPLPGFFGLVLRYASHTPMPALALAALPLALTQVPVRVLGVALLFSLALQWGRGPLAAAGALALVFDFTLCVLGGLSLSAQWRARREPLGSRLRAYFLVASLASSAALSVAAAALGPLPETLAGAVGVLALALILYFSLATSPSPLRAGLWLLPLTVSFLLQPYGRLAWTGAPTRQDLERGTGTRESIVRSMGALGHERVLTLVREWPRGQETDLAYANLASLSGGRSANGYDPMVPLRNRAALGSMSVGGTLPGAFFRSDPARLALLGVRWVQVPTTLLAADLSRLGRGDPLDVSLHPGDARLFPVPQVAATHVVVVSSLSDSVSVRQGEPVLRVKARLASTGRELEMLLLAGVHTAEWAIEREDVRTRVAHGRAPVAESWPGPGGGFTAHRYEGVLVLPGRYSLDAVSVQRLVGGGPILVTHLALRDDGARRTTAVTLAGAYASDPLQFVERAATPGVRLFEVPRAASARVVRSVRALESEPAVAQSLGRLDALGLDPREEAMASAGEARLFAIPRGARPGRAEIVKAQGGRLDVRGEGPGLLVVGEGWDRGWRAEVDGREAAIFRVNHVQMAVPLPAGLHRVVFRHRARGLRHGAFLFAGALGLGAFALWRFPRAAPLPPQLTPHKTAGQGGW